MLGSGRLKFTIPAVFLQSLSQKAGLDQENSGKLSNGSPNTPVTGTFSQPLPRKEPDLTIEVVFGPHCFPGSSPHCAPGMSVTIHSDSSAPAISVRHLSKTYVNGLVFRKRLPALRDVSFDVGRSEVFGLLGPNGAGKTTFLKILLGIIRKSGGSASMLGHPAGIRRGRRQVGYLPEQLRIPRHLTGFTALDYYGRLSGLGIREIKSKRHSLLEFVGLAGRGSDPIARYSKGMLQRLGLAQALLHDPQLLVLDEPTDGLDPGARAEIRKLMTDLRSRGVTIFLNSHLLQEVEMVCDRVAILDRGSLRYCGAVQDIDDFINQRDVASIAVRFELAGTEATIRTALSQPGCEILACEVQTGRVVLSARLADQAGIDAAIDRLRAADISLLGMGRQSSSLEEAFLKIVGNDTPDRDAPPT